MSQYRSKQTAGCNATLPHIENAFKCINVIMKAETSTKASVCTDASYTQCTESCSLTFLATVAACQPVQHFGSDPYIFTSQWIAVKFWTYKCCGGWWIWTWWSLDLFCSANMNLEWNVLSVTDRIAKYNTDICAPFGSNYDKFGHQKSM